MVNKFIHWMSVVFVVAVCGICGCKYGFGAFGFTALGTASGVLMGMFDN